MITLADIRKAVGSHCMVWEDGIEEISRGRIRIETRFRYPDGGSIELWFVQDTESLPQLRTVPKLSDLGETMTWLFHAQVKPWTSEKRRLFVQDVLSLYEIEREGGELMRRIDDVGQLGDEIIRLGQACLRVSDLVFTKRMTISSSVTEHVEAALDDADLSYVPDAEIAGRFGKRVRLDFMVKRPVRDSGILTLTSTTRSSAHYTANEIFTKWYDLQDSSAIERRVTVFDDRQQWYRDEDLERLEELSVVVPLTDTRRLVDILEAAA